MLDDRMERRETVVGDHDDIAPRPAIGFLTHGLDNTLYRAIRDLVGAAKVSTITADLRSILIRTDGARVQRIGRLPRIGDQELVTRAIRLLDIDHDEIGVRVLFDGAQGEAGLVIDEGADLVLVDRLELEVREVDKSRAQALGDAKVRLRSPEADVAVDVVYVFQHGFIARDEVGRVARDADAR